MQRSPRAPLVLAALATLAACGCSKPPPPKVDAATEQAEASKRAKERAYGGDAGQGARDGQGPRGAT